jgi:transposase-like protein
MSNYVPCPHCHSTNVDRVSFTLWGGALGPKLLSHVKCQNCHNTYNGKTGQSNTTAIIVYLVVTGAVSFGLMFLLFAGKALL